MLFMLLLAVADQTAPAAVPASTQVTVVAPKPKEERICRPVRDTYSRIGTVRECHTAAQWRGMGDNVDGHELDRLNADTRTTQNPGPR